MERKRLTITLRPDVLTQVDKTIDKQKIRNRSHAIEYLLIQALRPKIKKAVILAGGQGVKMRPFTYELPKAMLPLHGRPILEYIIQLFRDNEIRDLIIVIGPHGEKIQSYFGDGSKFGIQISYLKEKKSKGTAQALNLAKNRIKNQPFILYYGDVLAKIDLKELIDFHQKRRGIATCALTSTAKPWPYGVVKLRGDKILGFLEKPRKSLRLPCLISSGIYVLEPEIFKYIKRSSLSLEKDILPKLVQEGELFGYSFEGAWFDVGTPKIYETALKEWKNL